MTRQLSDYLENIIAGNGDRIYPSLDGKIKARIPLLIKRKTNKNVTRYSTNAYDLSKVENLRTNPNKIQLQNIAQAASLYAVFTTLGNDNKQLAALNAAINTYDNGGHVGEKQYKKWSKEAEALVNTAWKSIRQNIAPESIEQIDDTATMLLTKTIEELNDNGELNVANVTHLQAKEAGRLMLKAHTQNLMHSGTTPLSTNNEISEIYSDVNNKIKDFYQQRYGSPVQRKYLYPLMENNASAIQDLLDPANINFSEIKHLINFVDVDQKATEQHAISNADYRKARINSKKNAKGKITAYIKEDELWKGKGVYHLLLNVTHVEGQNSVSESLMLYSHNADATNPSSPNLLSEFIKEQQTIAPLIDEERAKELERQLAENKRLQEESAAKLVKENIEKRQKAIDEFQELPVVEDITTLQGTHLDQKNVAELALKYIPNIRIDADRSVWVPLANVAEYDPAIENIEGFQKLLIEKSELTNTNKLFDGVGEMRKNQCSVTVGNINDASVIILSEGLTNGLLTVEMLNQRGIDAAAVCGLDVGNLPHTVGKIIESHPTKPIINLADNDLFNSDQERRYLRSEIDALNIQANQKTLNVGMVRAHEMNSAIDLPFIAFDFKEDFEHNLEPLQQERKGSDIDDALNYNYEVLMLDGVENPAQEAWERVGSVLEEKVVSTLKQNVTPHWTPEKQHEYAWCASTDALQTAAFKDYYHLKSIISQSHEILQEQVGMSHEVYSSMLKTKYAPTLDEPTYVVDEELQSRFEEELDSYSEIIANEEAVSDTYPEEGLITSEPITALDEEAPHLISPTIVDSELYIDSKIAKVVDRINKLKTTFSQNKMSGTQYMERYERRMDELNSLVDEHARLLGVSSQQIQELPEISPIIEAHNQYLKNGETAANMTTDEFIPNDDDWAEFEAEEAKRPVDKEKPVFDFQVDDIDDSQQSTAPQNVNADDLLNQVLSGLPSDDVDPQANTETVTEQELSEQELPTQSVRPDNIQGHLDGFEQYIDSPNKDATEHYWAVSERLLIISAELSSIAQSENVSIDELKERYNLYQYYAEHERAVSALPPDKRELYDIDPNEVSTPFNQEGVIGTEQQEADEQYPDTGEPENITQSTDETPVVEAEPELSVDDVIVEPSSDEPVTDSQLAEPETQEMGSEAIAQSTEEEPNVEPEPDISVDDVGAEPSIGESVADSQLAEPETQEMGSEAIAQSTEEEPNVEPEPDISVDDVGAEPSIGESVADSQLPEPETQETGSEAIAQTTEEASNVESEPDISADDVGAEPSVDESVADSQLPEPETQETGSEAIAQTTEEASNVESEPDISADDVGAEPSVDESVADSQLPEPETQEMGSEAIAQSTEEASNVESEPDISADDVGAEPSVDESVADSQLPEPETQEMGSEAIAQSTEEASNVESEPDISADDVGAEPSVDESVADSQLPEPETQEMGSEAIAQSTEEAPSYETDYELELEELDDLFAELDIDDAMDEPASNEPATVASEEIESNALPTAENRELIQFFSKTLDTVGQQNQSTLKAVTAMVEKVMDKQSQMFEKQFASMNQLATSQQQMMERLLEQQTILAQQIGSLTQQVNGLSSTPLTNELSTSQESEARVNQDIDTPASESTDIDPERAALINKILEKSNAITSEQSKHNQIDQLIEQQRRNTPEKVGAAINPNGVSPSDAPTMNASSDLDETIRQLKSVRDTFADDLNHASDDTKTLLSKALKQNADPIDISKVLYQKEAVMNNVNGVLRKVFDGTNYHRRVAMSSILGECLRNNSNNLPSSAIVTTAATEITGNQNLTSIVAKQVVNGEISIDEYYRECESILGSEDFNSRMGNEYQQYVSGGAPQEPQQTNRPPITPDSYSSEPAMA